MALGGAGWLGGQVGSGPQARGIVRVFLLGA